MQRMVRLLLIVPRRSKSVTSLLIICQRWKFLHMKTTLKTQCRGAATKANFSGLKPQSFRGVYVVAEDTTHKHFRVATETLKPGPPMKIGAKGSRDCARGAMNLRIGCTEVCKLKTITG